MVLVDVVLKDVLGGTTQNEAYYITSFVDGYIHVCDMLNTRVQMFCTANNIHDHDIICCMHVHDHMIYTLYNSIIKNNI